jgi:hypothetical protein
VRKHCGLFDSKRITTPSVRIGPVGLLFFFSFCIPHVLHGQWSTSTPTSNALIINYGFEARVLTFDDGSSIFSHGITNSVYLTKLDPRGYRVWGPQPVVAHYNDTSDFGGGALIVSDNAGGTIVGWNDHRGAAINPITLDYYNDAWYMQRVDASGAVRWRSGGVLVVPPITGRKGGDIVTDGAGGAIFAGSEFGFVYPGAPNRERLFAARVNSNGEKLWEITLDSSLEANRIFFQGVVRAGRYIYIDVMRYYTPTQETYQTRIVDTLGVESPYSPWAGFSANHSYRDSILFSLSYPSGGNLLRKIGTLGDSLWSTVFVNPANCGSPSPFLNTTLVPDRNGGIYYVRGCRDTVLCFEGSNGLISRRVFQGIDSVGGYLFPDGSNGVVLTNLLGKAQRYDSLGATRWGILPLMYQSDPNNSYFEDFWGDNNGGILATFWTTSRGLCVQHTGRFGQPGIVPVPYAQELPRIFQLDQNFPNPFNPTTTINYELLVDAHVTLKVYDVLGKEVATLVDGFVQAGFRQAHVNAATLASGVYFYRLNAGSYTSTKKLVVLK